MDNSCPELVFGFLPAAVLQSINEVGNWKTRSNAIEQVQRGLASLGPAQAQVLLQQVPQFVAFVLQLLGDHNFKVVTAGLNVLADAAGSLGQALQQHIGELSPVLLTRLVDHRAPVSAAAVKAASSIMLHTFKSNPAALVNQLLQQQHEAAPGQDNSGLLEMLIMAMLKGHINSLNLPAAAGLMLKSMQRSISTSANGSKQHTLAMEAFALATDGLGAQLPNLLKQAGGTDLQVTLVLTQVQQLQRPMLAADGSIQHNSATQAAIAAADASLSSGFRLGAGLYDRGNNSSSSSFNSDSSMGLGSFKSPAPGNSSHRSLTEGSTAADGADGLGDSLSAAWGSEQQHQQMLPPGSLGALAAHARLLSNASNSLAAAAASCSSGGSGGSRPASGVMSMRAQLNNSGQDGRYSNKLQLSLSSASLGSEQPYTAGRSPLGSPRAQSGAAANSTSHNNSHLKASAGEWASGGIGAQQEQLQSQLSKLQLYNSSSHASNRHDSQLQQDSAATSSSKGQQQQAARTSSDCAGGLGHPQTGLQAALNLPHPNFRYQESSSNSTSTGALAGRRSTADQSRGPTDGAVPHLSAAEAAAGSGSTSSWLAAAGPGWAPADGLAGDAASGAYSPGRAETLSPSRGERLAFLKRRQVEKRAVSATGSVRGSNPWDSQDGALAAAAAAQAPTGIDAMDGPRASTAGPASGVAMDWRLSSSTEMPIGAGFEQSGYSPSGSPAPAEDSSPGFIACSSSSRVGHAPLLQWHIPTGPGGRVLPLGSSGTVQQQRRHISSPEPAGAAPCTQGLYSPSSSWDNSSGLSSGRAFQSSAGSVPVTGSPQAGQLLQNVPRTVSSAAVLVSSGANSYSGNGNADSSSSANTSGAAGYRSSRFQQVRSASASPAPAVSCEGATQSAGLPSGSSRLHGSSAGSSTGFGRQQQAQAQPTQHLQQQQQGLGSRAQTASAALGAAGCGDWGTGTSSSPASRMVSASGPNGSGCFATGTAAGAGSSSLTGAGSPTRSPGGLNRGSGLRGLLGADRPQSSGIAEVDLAGSELAPLQDPEAGLRQAVAKLQAANSATRMNIDWQGQLDALVDARRLIAHHTEVLRPSARDLVLAALPGVDELRSTTSRMALLFFQELPGSGLSIERELDEIVPVLLKKAGDLSTAGRDNFLAQEAAKALSLICGSVSDSKALLALIAAGATHKSPHVRSRTAAHLDEVVAGGAGLEAALRSGNWAVLDKVFKTAAGFLQEGSLDTRTYGKRLLWAVKAVLRGNRPDMDRLMSGITPEGVQRRVVEVLEGLSAPTPPPVNRAGNIGPRQPSRSNQVSGPSTPTFGVQPAPPFSAPPASMLTAAGAAAAAAAATAAGGGQDGPYSVGRSGYGGVGSSSGGSSAARRALFNSGSGNASLGLQVQGAAAAGPPGSPGSPTLSNSSSGRRKSAVNALAGISRGPGSPAASGNGSTSGRGALGGVGSVSGSDRRCSGQQCPPGPPGPMSPELQDAVEQVGSQLCSKDWRNRMDALRALSALGPALPEVPNAALEGLLQALVGRLSDGNAKVNQKALEVLCEVVSVISLRTLLIMPSLMPALTTNLGSTNDKLRGCASTALDAVAATVVPQPLLLMQGLSQAVANGSVKSKIAVIDKLGVLLPGLHQAQPQLTRLLLPAAFSLALEARGEARTAAAQLLALLTALLGSSAVLGAASSVSSATEQRVRELVFGGARS